MAITIVVASLSAAFWQWEQAGGRLNAEAEGTVQAIEYVRQGSVVNMPKLSVTFDDQSGHYAISYQSDADPDIAVGDQLTLRYDPASPEGAMPLVDVASEVERRRSFAIFSGLVGTITILAALAGRLDHGDSIAPRGPVQRASTR